MISVGRSEAVVQDVVERRRGLRVGLRGESSPRGQGERRERHGAEQRRGQRGRPPPRQPAAMSKLRLNYKRVAYLWYISVLVCIHVCPR